MDPTVSVSKGVFVTKGGFQRTKSKKSRPVAPLFEQFFTVEPWYCGFKEHWSCIENKLQCLNLSTYNSVLSGVVEYVRDCYDASELEVCESVVPAAALLTGVNQPDHLLQFSALTHKLRCEVTPHIATVHSQDAPSVRHLVESAVFQLINHEEQDAMDVSYEAEIESPTKTSKVRKTQCTMMALKRWFTSIYPDTSPNVLSPRKKKKTLPLSKSLVIIMPDFESFNCEVLQDFVTIVSSYTRSLPMVLVFGVATSVSALHKSFPYHVSSKLLIRVFQSHSSAAYLNQVLEEVFLSPACPFHLSGRAFELFTDVFLFYDFSVTGFTQGFKYCMMDHYYGDNIKSLCCEQRHISAAVAQLKDEDLENIRRLPSFRPHVESQDCQTRISLLTDDTFLRSHTERCLNQFHEYLFNFHTSLKLLFTFVKDLPRNVLGKQLRELYARCTSEEIATTSDFKECMQLLSFQSKTKLTENLTSCLKILNAALHSTLSVKPLVMSPLKNSPSKFNKKVVEEKKEHSPMVTVRVQLSTFLHHIQNANLEATIRADGESLLDNDPENMPLMNRQKLKEKLLKATKAERLQSEFEMVRTRLMEYLAEVFTDELRPPFQQPFHEIFVFSDVASVKKHIVGAPRGAIHTALNNPVAYLQCSCCELPAPDSVLASLPDVAVAYKLHRECGKLINLYDWLQAFVAVLEPPDGHETEERRDVPPHLQARFTRAVSELQFLGFIKASKRKTDHVTRLTW